MPVESTIRARVEAFASELVALIRSSAVDVVTEALGGTGRSPLRGPGRPAGALRSSRRTKGAKRDPKILAALTEKLGAFIRKNPGQRIEQIGKALGIATKDLALPVKKLIAARQVSTKGQKRATTYFAGGGRVPAKTTKKSKGRGKKHPGKKVGRRKGAHRVAMRKAPKIAVAPKAEAPPAAE